MTQPRHKTVEGTDGRVRRQGRTGGHDHGQPQGAGRIQFGARSGLSLPVGAVLGSEPHERASMTLEDEMITVDIDIKCADLVTAQARLEEIAFELFVPVKEEDTGKLHIERVETFPLPEGMSVEGYRTVETLKGFAQLLRATVAEYPSEELDELETGETAPSYIVVGARACDVAAMELVDKVQVEGEFEDPFYRIRREKMFTIAADCTDCGDSCFCTLVGRKPWPEKGYDLAISKVDAGYLVETGTERGERVVSENGDLFTAIRDGQEKFRDDARMKVVAKLKENNKDFPDATKMAEPLR